MKNYFLLPALIASCILNTPKASAKSSAAAELTYEWVSDSTYLFVYKLYNDCSGDPAPDSIALCINNRCDKFSTAITLYPMTGIPVDGYLNGFDLFGKDCRFPNKCVDPTSTLAGYKGYWYTGQFTLPSRCKKWEFSVTINGRNASIGNLKATNVNLWTGATLNNLDFQGDTSPYFSVSPCVNLVTHTFYTYNQGAVDVNNDSMAFSMAYSSKGVSCTDTMGEPADIDSFANANYNLTNNPFDCNQTFTFNKKNGQMTFTAAKNQTAVVTIICTSYRNGIEVGKIMRDVQFAINYQPAYPPTFNFLVLSGKIDGLTGNVVVSPRQQVSFKIDVNSIYKDALLGVQDNSADFSGSSFIYSGNGTPSASGIFNWTPGPADTGLHLLNMYLLDSACRLYNEVYVGYYSIPIFVTSSQLSVIRTENNETSEVFPNPTSGAINIHIPNCSAMAPLIAISDVTGREVVQIAANKQDMQVDLHGLSDGVYFIRINNGENVYSRKIILRK